MDETIFEEVKVNDVPRQLLCLGCEIGPAQRDSKDEVLPRTLYESLKLQSWRIDRGKTIFRIY
jgi:hypothetical protein